MFVAVSGCGVLSLVVVVVLFGVVSSLCVVIRFFFCRRVLLFRIFVVC